MSEKIPLKLYKYQSLTASSYTLENLQNRHIWFSKPEYLNDPFDCAIPFLLKNIENEKDWEDGYKGLLSRFQKDFSAEKATRATKLAREKFITNGKVNQLFRDHLTEVTNKNIEENRNSIREFGVACFSEDFDNILIWSHYADGHKGVCLEFDANYFPFNHGDKLQRIVYKDTYPLVHPADFLIKKIIPHETLTTKSTNWDYEKEWRVIHLPGNTALEYDPEALTGIYFGCSMSNNQKSEIATLLAKSATLLFNMKRSETQFSLEFEPYNK